jgi:hypothetical protein
LWLLLVAATGSKLNEGFWKIGGNWRRRRAGDVKNSYAAVEYLGRRRFRRKSMVDTRIRKNERCVIGLPACDYVFSSTRSCFIAYGFSTSGLERDILKGVLQERGIEPVEAGGQIEPGKFAFCTKICSKIIVSQFCIIIINNDDSGPNANVNMEYGLMLGHNKYVIPFQRETETLPFNVAGLDTLKYNSGNFRQLAIQAIDQAIKETSQNHPAPNLDYVINLFSIIKDTTFVNIHNDPGERAIYQLDSTFGFNLLVKFDGLSYVFLGNFGALQGHPIIWRLNKLMELLDARIKALPIRIQNSIVTEKAREDVDFFTKRLTIWLIVAGPTEVDEINSWRNKKILPFPLEIFTLDEVIQIVSQLPGAQL